jgi:Zn-dependent oligopeptidase
MDELEEMELAHILNAHLCLILARMLKDFRLNGIALDDESKKKVIESDQEILNKQMTKDKLKSQIQKLDQAIRLIKYRDKRNREWNQKRK